MYIVTTNGAVGIYKKKQYRPVGTQERPPGGVCFQKKPEQFPTPADRPSTSVSVGGLWKMLME